MQKYDFTLLHLKSQFTDPSIFDSLNENIPFTEALWKGRQMKRLIYSCSRQEIDDIPIVANLVTQCEGLLGLEVLSAFFNLYRDGNDQTPYHQDSYNCAVANISFGATRDFLTRPITGGKSTKYTCQSGDIILFSPEWNSKHQHSVPVRKRVTEPRISVVLFMK